MMSPEEQFIIQLVTILTGFIVTLASLYVKHKSDVRNQDQIRSQVRDVQKAVNGVPGEPTVKEQAAIISDKIDRQILPAIHQTAEAAKTAAEKGC